MNSPSTPRQSRRVWTTSPEGDSVTVTYKGTVSEADPFDGTVISVEKN